MVLEVFVFGSIVWLSLPWHIYHINQVFCIPLCLVGEKCLKIWFSDLYITLQVFAKPRQIIQQMSQKHQVAMAPEQTVQDMSSGGGELSDSLSISELAASRAYRRKSKVMSQKPNYFPPTHYNCSLHNLFIDRFCGGVSGMQWLLPTRVGVLDLRLESGLKSNYERTRSCPALR